MRGKGRRWVILAWCAVAAGAVAFVACGGAEAPVVGADASAVDAGAGADGAEDSGALLDAAGGADAGLDGSGGADAVTDTPPGPDGAPGLDGGGEGFDPCPALPPVPAGADVVDVDPEDAASLAAIAGGLLPGQVLRFADGTYHLDGAFLWITAPGVTLRSASGDPGAVVLDGGDVTTEVITVAASDVTVAELTIRRAHTHAVHVVTADGADTTGARIYRVVVVDPREQGIKINPGSAGGYPDDGEVACSRIELTDAGRPNVQPNPGGCYTGGVDAHEARGWVVRDNEIRGFWCDTGLSEHAIHFWRGCRDTLVERNVLVDNARGVGFGLAQSGDARTYDDDPCPAAAGAYIGHYGGVVRNNFIAAMEPGLLASPAGFDCGVCLWSACGAQVVHNTVAASSPPFSSVEWRFAGSQGVGVTNNLVVGPLRERGDAQGTQAGNVQLTPPGDLEAFVNFATADLHLADTAPAARAVDQGVAVPPGLCDQDVDGDPRGALGPRDVGADERRAPR